MKFLGSLIVMALLSLTTVFAGPPQPIYTQDGVFEYYLLYDDAYIIRVLDKNAKKLVVRPYTWYNGKRFNVTNIASGFDESKVETLTIHKDVAHTFYLGTYAISTAKNLKCLEVDAPDVIPALDSFDTFSPQFEFKGKGIDAMMMHYAKDFLKENFNIGKRTYTYQTSDYQRMQHLYELGRHVKKTISYESNVPNASNGIHTLIFKRGNSLGIARAFRLLTRAMGMGYNDVHVGSDKRNFSWNLCNLSKTWVNYDIVHTTFRTGQGDVSVFYGDSEFTSKVLTPAYGTSSGMTPAKNWVIYVDNYGYQNEIDHSNTENFSDWLIRNRMGGRKD